MSTRGQQDEPAAVAATDSEPVAPARRRGLAYIASELWHQKPGARAERPAAGERSEKQVVDGLDQWELRLSIAATVVEAVLTPLFYWYFRTHGSTAVRNAASEFLITGIITTVVLLLGTVFKRRALVGFAAFMTGMAWLTYGSLYFSLMFLVFGGWLILRVMRKQKQDRAAGKKPDTFGSRRSTAAPTPSVPKASKRYTPPKRATAKGKAATGRRAAQGSRR